MMRTLIKSSYKIVILCRDSVPVLKNLVKKESIWKDKIVHLPHPNYIDAYKKTNSVFSSANEVFKILFFGSIRP